ncbi:hypothetical protein Tco_0266893 [Tanacetum coccineum]
MEGLIEEDDDDESRYEQWRRWNVYTNYDDAYEINHDVAEREELCEIHELSVCNIRRFEMIKYSFRQDKEYVVIKEDEYDNLARTSKDACRAYQEIFRMMDEGWMDLVKEISTNIGGEFTNLEILKCWNLETSRRLFNTQSYSTNLHGESTEQISREFLILILFNSLIMEYLVNISKRRAFWSLNGDILKVNDSDYQYAVSIKEDTTYPCLHSPKTTKETSSIRRIQRRLIRRIEDIVCKDSRRYQAWSLLQETPNTPYPTPWIRRIEPTSRQYK